MYGYRVDTMEKIPDECKSTPLSYKGDVLPEDSIARQEFDWRDVRALCIAPDPHHPLYGMSVKEYTDYISINGEEEEQKVIPLHFRAPDILSFSIPILARRYGLSMRKYLATMIVIGLITFQKDYHEQYSTINARIDSCFNMAHDKLSLRRLWQVAHQPINLQTASRDNKGFTPSLPEWIIAALTTSASELNMTNSDMACLCIAISVLNNIKDSNLPDAYAEELTAFIGQFVNALNMLDERVTDTYARICI
jgi:hypothetical protein